MSITLLQKDSFNFHRDAKYNKFKIETRLGIDCILNCVNDKLLKFEELKHHLLFVKGRTGSGKSSCMPSRIFIDLDSRRAEHFASSKKYKAKIVVNVVENRVILAKSIPRDNCKNEKYLKFGDNTGYKTGSGKIDVINPSRLIYMTTEIFRLMISNNDDLGNIVIIDECHDLDVPMITLLHEIKDYIFNYHGDLRKLPLFIFTSATLPINNMIKYFFKDSKYDLTTDIYNDALMINYIAGMRNYPVDERFLTTEFKNDNEFVNWILTEGIEESLKSNYTVDGIPARDILIFSHSSTFHKMFNIHKNINYPIYKCLLNTNDLEKKKKWRNENLNKTRILIIPYAAKTNGFGDYLLSNAIDPDKEAQQNEIKIFISTNVVEIGKTFNTWYQVYDNGLRYTQLINPLLYSSKLKNIIISPIDKSTTIQRCGRVGRKTNGIAFRLYTKDVFNSMRKEPEPQNINMASNALMLLSCKKDTDIIIDTVKNNDYIFQNSFDTNLITGQDLTLTGYTTPWGEYINDIRNEIIEHKWILEAEYLYYTTNNKSLEDLLILCRNSRKNMSLLCYEQYFKFEYFKTNEYDYNNPNIDRINVIFEARQEYIDFLIGVNTPFLKIKT